jgi:hypothetical protein
MNIRDQEIKRLVAYAKGLGVKVIFSDAKNSQDSASYTLDGTEITVYTKNQKSKTETILTLIHEIAHSLDNIHRLDRELDVAVDKALDPDDNGEIGRRKRKIILNSEIAATEYWHIVYKETDIKIPIWKLEAQMEMDIWQYQTYYETGLFPIGIERKLKKKELYAKHRETKYE